MCPIDSSGPAPSCWFAFVVRFEIGPARCSGLFVAILPSAGCVGHRSTATASAINWASPNVMSKFKICGYLAGSNSISSWRNDMPRSQFVSLSVDFLALLPGWPTCWRVPSRPSCSAPRRSTFHGASAAEKSAWRLTGPQSWRVRGQGRGDEWGFFGSMRRHRGRHLLQWPVEPSHKGLAYLAARPHCFNSSESIPSGSLSFRCNCPRSPRRPMTCPSQQ